MTEKTFESPAIGSQSRNTDCLQSPHKHVLELGTRIFELMAGSKEGFSIALTCDESIFYKGSSSHHSSHTYNAGFTHALDVSGLLLLHMSCGSPEGPDCQGQMQHKTEDTGGYSGFCDPV